MALSLEQLTRKASPKPPKMAIYGPGGVGKAQPIDCHVQTPTGPKKIGSLAPGHTILGSDGKPQTVLAVYPQGVHPTYQITFSDGASTRCNADHLWRVSTRKARDMIRTTAEIAQHLIDHPSGTIRIPEAPVCELTGGGQTIDPYLLGFYLADGCGTGSVVQLTISHDDSDIADMVSSVLPQGYHLSGREAPGCTQFNVVSKKFQKGEGFINLIRALGLDVKSAEKFIPHEYRVAPIEMRKKILAGLMDGDGSALNGRTSFHTGSETLAENVCWIIRSLGGKAKLHRLDARDDKSREFRVNVRTDFNPFLCARKSASWRHSAKNPMRRNIVSVKRVDDVEQVCIRVSNSDSLYLTDHFIVTHNTTLASEFPDPFFIMTEDGGGLLDLTTFSDPTGRPKIMTTFGDVMDALQALVEEDHGFSTLVIDSVTRMEPIVWAEVCDRNKWNSIEDPGYGKGYLEADAVWREFLAACTFLRDTKNMAIVMIGHETVQGFSDPTTDSYDRYTMRLHKRAEAMIREDVDVLGFINQITTIAKEKSGFNKETNKAKGSGQRALNVEPRPAFQAKNRFGMPGQILINPGEGYAALAPYLPTIGTPKAAEAA